MKIFPVDETYLANIRHRRLNLNHWVKIPRQDLFDLATFLLVPPVQFVAKVAINSAMICHRNKIARKAGKLV